MDLKVRPIYRVLGILVSVLGMIAMGAQFLHEKTFADEELVYFSICTVFFLTVVMTSCIKGTVPGFITRFLDEESRDDWNNAGTFFTKFSAKSVGFALIFLLMVFFTIFLYQ